MNEKTKFHFDWSVVFGLFLILFFSVPIILGVYSGMNPCVLDHDIEDEGLYCVDCGKQFRKSCPSCGAKPFALNCRFCDQCGYMFEVTGNEG